MQKKLRTAEPVCGITFDRHHIAGPATFSGSELLDPIIECEFFFTLAKSLPPRATEYGAEDIEDAVGKVEVGIEIAECRFARKNLPPAIYIQADGFASGRYVHGNEVNGWRAALAKGIDVRLTRNGAALSQGASSDVMGNPVNAVTWLANRLIKAGKWLKAGQVVSSGSCNILVPARQGDRFIAEFSGIGAVEVNIA
jgi:2-keto-4-pentenoate hydratase